MPRWSEITSIDRERWEEAKAKARGGPRVLIATGVGGLPALTGLESVLAVALTLRGAEVHLLLCDRALPACLRAEIVDLPDPSVLAEGRIGDVLCESCFLAGERLFAPLGLTVHHFNDFIVGPDRAFALSEAAAIDVGAIERFRFDGAAVGEHALAGALRYFARGDLHEEPLGDAVLRRYMEGAILTARVTERLLQQYAFRVACFNHGLYSPHGIIGEVCRSASVRVVNWNLGSRNRCFIFSHDDTYHHTLLAEPTDAWEHMAWTDQMEADIVAYLRSKWSGTRDWVWFHERPEEDFEKVAAELGLDLSRPIVGLLTNVIWDAQLHYRANAFPDMRTWLLETIRYFERRPDLQLLVRVHPAEVRGTNPSRQPVLDEIEKEIPSLPPNVFVISPDSPISTYTASLACNAVIIYGTKTGVELCSFGVPIIVAGEAWIRNKGFTRDASSREEYFALMDELPFASVQDDNRLTRARKYAYHIFFRRMIPLTFMEPMRGWPPYRVALSGLHALAPGADPGLDVVCDGILHAQPFVYRAESLGLGEGDGF